MNVSKTIKLFIGGEFPRTESGRSTPVHFHGGKQEYARICQASRKDFRNAVEAAEKALGGWSKRASYNRGQILYRMAEMAQGKKEEFAQLFVDILGLAPEKARQEAQKGIDAFIQCAGWADKYSQLLCSVNQVNGPFHNFTTPAPIGVTVFVEDDAFNFENLCKVIGSVVLAGNTLIVLHGAGLPAVVAPLSEVLATSDLPPGTINLLTGQLKELISHISGHYEVQNVLYGHNDDAGWKEVQLLGVDNLKRSFRTTPTTDSLELIFKNVEMQTVWHPIGT